MKPRGFLVGIDVVSGTDKGCFNSGFGTLG